MQRHSNQLSLSSIEGSSKWVPQYTQIDRDLIVSFLREERSREDPIAFLDIMHKVTNLFHDSSNLMSDSKRSCNLYAAMQYMKIRAAYASACWADDSVGLIDDLGGWDFFDGNRKGCGSSMDTLHFAMFVFVTMRTHCCLEIIDLYYLVGRSLF
jgi:hypothetical protein